MEDTRKLLGRRLKSLRNMKGLTQQELGEKADVNYKYLGAENPGHKQSG